MNRIELYNKTTTTLLNAYKNGTLFHGNCHACAVGNICRGQDSWTKVIGITSYSYKGTEIKNFVIREAPLGDDSDGCSLIKSTGYTPYELAKIEYAFESSIGLSHKGHKYWIKKENQKQGQYIGLKALFKVLAEIHGQPTDKEVQKQLDTIATTVFDIAL